LKSSLQIPVCACSPRHIDRTEKPRKLETYPGVSDAPERCGVPRGTLSQAPCPTLASVSHEYTQHTCIYCGKPSESIDHVLPRARGGLSVTENCVPSCLSCNGHKSDADAFQWYRRQRFYDPRRAMAIRAWMDGDLRLAVRLLQWATPSDTANPQERQRSRSTTAPGRNNDLNLQAA
jgi:5-methylcytosine-specific restriction endonuclease McrA